MIVKNNYAGETGEKTEEWSDCYFSGQVCAIACDTGEYILGSFKGFRNIATEVGVAVVATIKVVSPALSGF